MTDPACPPSAEGSDLTSFKQQKVRLDRKTVPLILMGLLLALGPWVMMALPPLGIGGRPVDTGRSIAIEDFSVAIRVDESSSVEVEETIRLRFDGTWNGIHRFIPVESRSTNGVPHHIGLHVREVTDERGQRLKFKRSRHGNDVDLKIYVPNAADAVRTVVVRYRIDHGLRFFEDHDELYWNVTGDQWPYPIGAARVKVALPGRLVNVRANAFTGAAGSKERAASITIDGIAHEPDDAFKPAGESPPPDSGSHVVEIAASRSLGIREGLTAAVAWNPGVIKRPSVWAKAWSTWWTWLVDHSLVAGIFGGPIMLFGLLFSRWWRVGREPRMGPIVVQYEPPAGLGPGEAGTLIDNKPDNRDLIANLVDAAVKGVIRIREVTPGGWLSRATYAFELLEPPIDWQAKGVNASGERILRGIFNSETPQGAGHDDILATVMSTALEDKFYTHLPTIRDAMYDDLVERGFYSERPDKVTNRYLVYGVVSSIAIMALAILVGMTSQGSAKDFYFLAAFLMGFPTLLFSILFATIMPARTVAGVRARAAIRGFREFLSRVDAHRLSSMPLTPELFERYLPYAIALGVERRWARSFKGICTVPPQWYAGSQPIDSFDLSTFSHSLGQMSSCTAASMTSSPDSGDGSGFSGGGGDGGCSGGGDGGGGGSGF
jgi:uncharacterized membrane protein YgcG